MKSVRVSVCVKARPSVCGVPKEQQLSSSLPYWIWIIIGVAIFFFLVILILLIVCCCCRDKEEEEEKKMNSSPPDYDNDTAHRKRQPNQYAPYGADNAGNDIDFGDPKIRGVYANPVTPSDTLPNGAYLAKPVNVIDYNGGGGGGGDGGGGLGGQQPQQPPLYWPSSNGTAQRPLSSYNPYMMQGDHYNYPQQQQQQPQHQHGTFRPVITDNLDYDEKKLDGYDSGYPEDHAVAAPQRQPTQRTGGKRTIYEVVV